MSNAMLGSKMVVVEDLVAWPKTASHIIIFRPFNFIVCLFYKYDTVPIRYQ